ncbi:CpsD/CapB family tyrosine-protein kinase, partial [Salmonella enterica subsp. enterica serovar Istanbul]|nr:CpsD/CapB family tyrosine-protein kinase [Salmonella enterica subsp. enterica serovar Istanbul]
LHPAGGKIIALVSALPGEGKTTVAASFATFVAKSGSRVLVIDADLRNPSMTNTLGYTNAPGLLDLVAGNASFDELVITDTKYKFDFLPAAARIRPSNSSDILNAQQI